MSEERALEEYYTYGDYKSWDDDLRWELIDGEVFCMSPGPGTEHQSLSGNLFGRLFNYFNGKECRVFAAPFDVTLPKGNEPEDEIDTVVQPDIMILCDMLKLQRNGIKGAPDVVFEILSPSTAHRDLDDKFRLYERAGVKEYVIVDPQNCVIYAYRIDSGGRFSWKKAYGADDVLEFGMFPDLKIPLSPVWKDIRDLYQ
ncbi:MAG: Uma2 family endonuclease [Synergistaceae bacterium]|nr:Uma2 family endonuclease [Synergistaceae bacterium]